MAVKRRQLVLSRGRPPINDTRDRMSSRQSRTIIRAHHQLHKKHAAAIKDGDRKLADRLLKELESTGGLKAYQAASKQGQSSDRGGDSSKVLVEWLLKTGVIAGKEGEGRAARPPAFECLEVGALSNKNKISQYPSQIHMTRIDLHSQGLGIEKQDFMERPLPARLEDKFDIISLSLVLNYIPDISQRGEMLRRAARFLRTPKNGHEVNKALVPVLFLVLPLPCINNSRYLDETLLLKIMASLGLQTIQKKITAKLCFYLFSSASKAVPIHFKKQKLKDGPGLNNFCIVLE